jgi:SPP1 gp7 family putative phage head morphogenesis protein
MNTELLAALIAAGVIDQETAEIIERQSDPVAARAWAEAQLTTATAASLQAQLGRLLELVGEPGDDETAKRLAKAWRKEDNLMWANMRGALATIATERSSMAAITAGAFDTFNLVNDQIMEWVDFYYRTDQLDFHGSIPNLNRVSRNQFADEFNNWTNGRLGEGFPPGLPGLIAAIEPTFGVARAENIAVTEVTRIFVQAIKEAESTNPFTVGFTYLVAADERVCPVCTPARGLVALKDAATFPDGGSWPPRHPRCRCDITPETEGTMALAAGTLALNEAPPQLPPLDEEEEEAPPMLANGFPAELDRLQVVRRLGGSTGAELVRDPVDGREYVRKRGGSPEHLLEEVAADEAYRALGIHVPALNVYDTPGGPVKLTEYIAGKTLAEIKASDRSAYDKAILELKKGFAADALLGNWDVVGMGADNVLVGNDKKVYRIDNGGSLRRRAQGGLKNADQWNEYPDELWTMRNRSVNASAADVFEDVDYPTVVKQMKALLRKRQAVLDALPADVQATVGARFDVMADLVKMHGKLDSDKWDGKYIDDFARHSVGLRKSGLIAKLPKKLSNRGVMATDENGRLWDNLRGNGRTSIVGQLADYMSNTGGDHGIISYWAGAQAGSSWSSASMAIKHFMVTQRGGNYADFYWQGSVDAAKKQYDATIAKVGEAKYRESWTAWHAFNYEFMRNVDFKGNNRRAQTTKLIRTESRYVMGLHNLSPGDKGTMVRGAMESTSAFQSVVVAGSEVTTQLVPHHRIFGNYMLERSPGANSGMFLGDRENEVVAMMEGLEVTYER